MSTPIELPSRTISFRTDLQVMVVRWHTYAPLETVMADYAEMLGAAEARDVCDWLLDVRRREKVTAELSAWVAYTFYPRAVVRLAPRRLRLAVLSSPTLTEAYRSAADQKKYVQHVLDPAQPYNVGLFEDEGQAMQWLCAATAR